jgi:hypothetical protein
MPALILLPIAHTKEILYKLKSEALKQPPHSPDLAPSDFHLFSAFKEALRSQ